MRNKDKTQQVKLSTNGVVLSKKPWWGGDLIPSETVCWLETLITRHFQMCNSSASDCWNATSAIQDRPGVVTKRIWPTNVNAWWLLEARIYSDNLLQTLEGKDYEMTLPCTNPQASSNHGPVIWTLVFKRVLKRIFSFLMWDHFFNLACNSNVLCHQGCFFNARLFSVLLTLYGPRVASEAESATAVRTDGGSFTESWRERSASRSGKRSGGSSFSLSVSMAEKTTRF